MRFLLDNLDNDDMERTPPQTEDSRERGFVRQMEIADLGQDACGVVVGEVRFKVSETTPASNRPAARTAMATLKRCFFMWFPMMSGDYPYKT